MMDEVVSGNVTMYPVQWDIVDAAAMERGFITARGPNRSQMLRYIVNEWIELKENSKEDPVQRE